MLLIVAAIWSAFPMKFSFLGVILLGITIFGVKTMADEMTPRNPSGIPERTQPGKCANCHGYFGVSDNELIPNLAGQKRVYLKNQLNLFRAQNKPVHVGTVAVRRNDLMALEVMSLEGAKVDGLAAYFAEQPCQSKAPPGRFRVTRKVHRCAVCHGWFGISKMPMIPNLAGQKKQYLAKQLEMFRASATKIRQRVNRGFRYNSAMANFALPMLLTDEEIDNLAGYFSVQNCKGKYQIAVPQDLFHGRDEMDEENNTETENYPGSTVNAAKLGSDEDLSNFKTSAGKEDEEVDEIPGTQYFAIPGIIPGIQYLTGKAKPGPKRKAGPSTERN